MNVKAKEQVLKINKGEVPQGYKKTKLGIIPEDWSLKNLGSLGEFKKGKGISIKDTIETGLPAMMYGDIYVKYNTQFNNVDFRINQNTAQNSTKVNKGDLLFTGSGETAIEIGKCITYQGEEPIYIGGDIIGLTPEKNDSLFLAYQQNSYEQIKQKARFGQGHSVVHIYTHHIKSLIIALPPLLEQQKIAEILSTCDKVIELKEKLINQKKLQKKYFIQALLNPKSPNFRRLVGFNGEWKELKLKKCLLVRKEKHHRTEEYELYSLTIENGVTHKTDRYNREFLVKNNNKKYKIAYMDDIVYNPPNLRYGAIALNKVEKPVLLSPIYEILYAKKSTDTTFLSQLLTSKRQVKIFATKAEGTLIERMAVKVDVFLSTKIQIPCLSEQKEIGKVLLSMDKEINLLEKELEQQKLKKKALMQLLLTGKMRVNIS
jgi:type I restriction enzyme S subunit